MYGNTGLPETFVRERPGPSGESDRETGSGRTWGRRKAWGRRKDEEETPSSRELTLVVLPP